MKVKRFVYVNAGGSVVHRHYKALVEGSKMACGRRVRPGWLWFRGGRTRLVNICKQCERAA